MDGYTEATYGEAFADVYDEWYDGISDAPETVATLARLTPPHAAVLELGVGTGRLAVPLAEALGAAGSVVHGLDTSPAMLARLSANDPARRVVAHPGDMVTAMPPGPFAVVFVAYNTLFSLRSEDRQRACFAAVARRLTSDGMFVVEAFVPGDDVVAPGAVTVRSMSTERVVLSVARNDPAVQQMHGHYIDITEVGGVRLRPWSIRYATPGQLDAMAHDAGLVLRDRWSSFACTPFDDDSVRHVSVYVRRSSAKASHPPGNDLG